MISARFVARAQRVLGSRAPEIIARLARIDLFRVLDYGITALAFGGLALIAPDVLTAFCAIVIAMTHACWMFFAGQHYLLRQFKQERRNVVVSDSMRAEIESMKPGTALRYKLVHTKHEFVVIEADDYEHILSLANLKAVPINKSQQENNDANRSSG